MAENVFVGLITDSSKERLLEEKIDELNEENVSYCYLIKVMYFY